MFSEQKKVDLRFYSTKLVGNRVTLSFCKKSIFNSKILSHGKVGHSVSLISWRHFTNMTILVPARFGYPVNGDC